MKSRDIVLAYNWYNAEEICRINCLNFHKIIIFNHGGMFSTKLNRMKKGNEIKIVKDDNIEFQMKLEKLRGLKGTFTFYFEDKTEFEYTTDCLWMDIYTIFDVGVNEYLSTLDPQVQELHKLSWKVRF